MATLPRLPVFEAIAKHDPDATAVVHARSGRTFRYGSLLADVSKVRDQLVEAAGGKDLNGERIAYMVENSYDYIVTLLAILAARAIAVPLSPPFPLPELQYVVDHSEACLVVASAKFDAKVKELLASPLQVQPKPTLVSLSKIEEGSRGENVTLETEADPGKAGMMLYTSGTTNRPKGVLIPEHVMTAQARSLIHAWEYAPSDRLLHVLPLHHIHGTINALYTPLIAGSSVEFLFPFNADQVWRRFAAPFVGEDGVNGKANGASSETNGASSETNGASSETNGASVSEEKKEEKKTSASEETKKKEITFFTVVPTVYNRLMTTHKTLSPALQEATREAISPKHLRLSISGSAALPTPIKQAWTDLSRGNVLLERFGMTEVGMALSCGLDEADRVDGSVGWPLPSVEARLVELDTGKVIEFGEEVDPETQRERAGEIQLRGPTIFQEYWHNPKATQETFDGPWFKTGDVAVRRPVEAAGKSERPSQDWTRSGNPLYFILGRRSADIIKTGGEKVSALEVERELLSLPEVAEAAVVAVPSGKWGQKVGAAVVLEPHVTKWTAMDMRRALKPRLANYKIPQLLRIIDEVPRNAMGKITKKKIINEVFLDDFSGDEAPPPPKKTKAEETANGNETKRQKTQ